MAIFEAQRGLCAYFSACGNVIAKSGPGKYHVDHIEPIAPKNKARLPGRNDPFNLSLLCKSCNLKKNNKDPYTFTQQHEGRLFPDLPRDPQAKPTSRKKVR